MKKTARDRLNDAAWERICKELPLTDEELLELNSEVEAEIAEVMQYRMAEEPEEQCALLSEDELAECCLNAGLDAV